MISVNKDRYFISIINYCKKETNKSAILHHHYPNYAEKFSNFALVGTYNRYFKIMFIAILTYKKPLEEVDRYLQAHRDFLAEHYAAGDLITSGPQNPRIGGVIMIKSNNRIAVESLLAQDPFNINDIADYQIVEFTPTLFCDQRLTEILN